MTSRSAQPISSLSGVVPPVAVPLCADRSLDVESLERSLNRMIDAGLHGLFALGSTGEVVFSTDQRRDEILKETVRIVDGRLPILAGVIDTETNRVIEHAKRARDLGADALVATAPFYALGGVKEIQRHFEAIRQAVDLPLFAYDIPVCVHQKLPINLLLELGKAGVLSGVKDSSGDDVSFRFLLQLNEAAGHPLRMFTGHEVVVDGAYLGGADGSVPGLANVDPVGYRKQWDAYQAGDWEAVRREQDRLARLMWITQIATTTVGFGAGVGAFKTALRELGVFATNQMPDPVPAMGTDEAGKIRQILAEAGLL